MGYIYTVSDNYLETVYEHTREFQYIDVIGYRSIKKATSRLHLTNSKDILGYLYIDDEMPEYEDMMRFIRKIELTLDKTKILLLVVRDALSCEEFLNQYAGSLVTIRVISGFEVLTDTILKNALGTIYSTQAQPYLDLEEDEDQIIIPNPHYLEFNRLFSKQITDLISPVQKLNDLTETERFDGVLTRIRNKDTFENEYRRAFIRAKFNSRHLHTVHESPYDSCLTMALEEILREEIENERKNKV